MLFPIPLHLTDICIPLVARVVVFRLCFTCRVIVLYNSIFAQIYKKCTAQYSTVITRLFKCLWRCRVSGKYLKSIVLM